MTAMGPGRSRDDRKHGASGPDVCVRALRRSRSMAARVVFPSGFSRRYTGGVREFTVEAKNLRGVIKEMDRLYPGLGEHLVEETTVAIDGAIHETAYFQPIREGCEIFFIPKLEGG